MTNSTKQWIHMVGIAGAGMSGIATVLSQQGYRISGSDLQNSNITERLKKLGIEVYEGHSSSHVKEGVDLLVISSAIPSSNPELEFAQQKNIPVLKRGQMLAQLVNDNKGIAVAGAHGKTTTTSMLCIILQTCGLDPSFIIGGEIQGTDAGSHLGKGDLYVVEADESDASFLNLKPYIAVVTNIENDHLDFYKSLDNIKNAFQKFISRIKPDGFALVYGDAMETRELRNNTPTNVITYGENEDNDYYMQDWISTGKGSRFSIFRKEENMGSIELTVPGKHNALNALAATIVALRLGLNINEINSALKTFKGAKRRFEVIGSENKITIVDDYAHHPTEIKATINAAKNYHEGRLIVVFQPHRYTRTLSLGEELGKSFSEADKTIFTEIYAAGEQPIPGISGKKVYKVAKDSGCESIFISCMDDIVDYLVKTSQENDLIITMGAGDIHKVGVKVIEQLRKSVIQA